jgi:two-component system, NtrC family, nitrogen regulation sensor histidine kinase NtrY
MTDEKQQSRRRVYLIVLSILVPTLLILGWSQASFNLSFIQPSSAQETILLLALSTFIFLAFVIFALILARILLKLYVERRQKQLGSRFKTKMVVAFLALSVVPVCFLFVFAYGLVNRSIDRWFGIPLDTIRRDADLIVEQLELQFQQRTIHDAVHLANNEDLTAALREDDAGEAATVLAKQISDLDLDGALCFDRDGQLLARAGSPQPESEQVAMLFSDRLKGKDRIGRALNRWRSKDETLLLGAQPVDNKGERLGTVIVVSRLPINVRKVADEIQKEAEKYDELTRRQKDVKRNALSILGLLTLLILFLATWYALFVSKQVTIPIQALAEGTHEVSKGNLGYQVTARADDELGSLILSFNEMTRQLQESRRAIEQAALELQLANRELEEHGNTMETILENVSVGVVSFDPEGQVTKVNSTMKRMLGHDRVQSAKNLADLFSIEDLRDVSRLFRRADRQGVITRQMELELNGRRTVVAVTVSSIRARHGKVGSVLVLEDISDLLRAQRASAWSEVAQRVAHEIKNPLTPIQLSAERIHRLVTRSTGATVGRDLLATVEESARLIDREVATLKTLVDEFSSYARFPASKPVASRLNVIVDEALNIFTGRLEGIILRRQLSPDLPVISADPEQMKRVVINLVDNAAEALANSQLKEVWVRTTLDPDRDVVEMVVADSGPGIPPEAKEKLFLPYFSTKRRGTGLGLAIVSRIIAEHKGTIRVEENQPAGTRFVIELPVDRTAVPSATTSSNG